MLSFPPVPGHFPDHLCRDGLQALFHAVLQCQQTYGIDVPGDTRRHLADGYQRRLVEYLGAAAADGLQVVLDVSEALILGEAPKVVSVEDPTHQGACLRVAQLLEQAFLPAHDDRYHICLGEVLLAYEVELGIEITGEVMALIDDQDGPLAVVVDEVQRLMDLPEHGGGLVGPGEKPQRCHELPEHFDEAPLPAHQVDDLVALGRQLGEYVTQRRRLSRPHITDEGEVHAVLDGELYLLAYLHHRGEQVHLLRSQFRREGYLLEPVEGADVCVHGCTPCILCARELAW